jgi:hypothetical protein
MRPEVEVPLQIGVTAGAMYGGGRMVRHVGNKMYQNKLKDIRRKSAINMADRGQGERFYNKLNTQRTNKFNKRLKKFRVGGSFRRLGGAALGATALGLMNKRRIDDWKSQIAAQPQQQYYQ